MLASWREWARGLKSEVVAVGIACRDPRVPWHAKVFAACLVAYALSPIDLIPDFIPVLGYLDDLVLLPLGVALLARMIPREVLEEARAKAAPSGPCDGSDRAAPSRPAGSHDKAAGDPHGARPGGWAAAVVIVAIWIALAALAVTLLVRVAAGTNPGP